MRLHILRKWMQKLVRKSFLSKLLFLFISILSILVSQEKKVAIIGRGPAGLFSAIYAGRVNARCILVYWNKAALKKDL